MCISISHSRHLILLLRVFLRMTSMWSWSTGSMAPDFRMNKRRQTRASSAPKSRSCSTNSRSSRASLPALSTSSATVWGRTLQAMPGRESQTSLGLRVSGNIYKHVCQRSSKLRHPQVRFSPNYVCPSECWNYEIRTEIFDSQYWKVRIHV